MARQTRQRIQLSLALFCMGLLCITSVAVFAQGVDPIPVGSDAFYEFILTGQLLYVAPGTDGESDVFLMESVGLGDGIEVTNVSLTSGANEKDPQFTPDGRIAFLGEADPNNSPGVFSLFIIDDDGQNEVQVTPNGVNVRNYTVNADATRVAFSAQWGSNQIQIYGSDLAGANQVTLTPGEGFHADFPTYWRNADGKDEITYIRAEGGTSQVAVLDPLTAGTRQVSNTPDQKFLLTPLSGEYYSYIQREDADHDWELMIQGYDGSDAMQLTDNATNDCCAVLDPNGEGIYHLSDVEGGGRDIYWVGLDGSDRLNLTENDEREYTSVTTLLRDTLLVGYTERVGDDETPASFFGLYSIPSHDLLILSDDENVSFTEGASDPDVLGEVSLEQLEGLADAGLLQTCEMGVHVASANMYTEPRLDAPVIGSLPQDTAVQVNAVLPAGNIYAPAWYRLSDGNWVKASDVTAVDDCILLPRISSLNL